MLEWARRYGIDETSGLRSLDKTVDLPWTDPSQMAPFLVSVRKTPGARMNYEPEPRLGATHW